MSTRTRPTDGPTGVLEAVDALVCTADIGVAKPDAAAYRTACRALATDPALTFFTDDTPKNVLGARRAGLHAEDFIDVDTLCEQLSRFLGSEHAPTC